MQVMNTNFEFKSIQKKLVAAVAMVLVAAIMVVSSSYAWFTLSTAPEVTGITTSVGSNGNLEMALNVDNDVNNIKNGYGATNESANETWGNLVDLHYDSYGLSSISLSPARLNMTTGDNGHKFGSSYLYTPVYGTDGRVSNFEANTVTGKPNGDGGWISAANYWGVRGIGVASGLSAGAKALRDAKIAVNTARDLVTRLARTSLEVDAINLANLMVANLASGKTEVTPAELTQVRAAITNLESISTSLKDTMDKVVQAVATAQGVDISGKTISYSAAGATVEGVTIEAELQAGLGAAFTTWTSINTKITTADGVLDNASTNGEGNYDYAVVAEVMNAILSKQDLSINGKGFDQWDQDELIQYAVEKYGNQEKLVMNIVSGIYKDIADFVGTYSASANITLDVAGFNDQLATLFPNGVTMGLQMKADTAAPTIQATGVTATQAYYFDYYVTQLNKLATSDSGANTDEALDIYAYAVDLAFRTNAASSNLMLQTYAASRVGDDSTAALQGGGSYMEFTLGDGEGYTLEQMQNLMSAIRVVLFDPETNEIFGIAALDMNVAVINETAKTVKAYLYLYEYTSLNDVLTLGDKIAPDENGKTAITALEQNKALALSALVYLDGDYVDNGDVAINGDSMNGVLNLQFSSDATLRPMDYTFSEQGTTQPGTTDPSTEPEASEPATSDPTEPSSGT